MIFQDSMNRNSIRREFLSLYLSNVAFVFFKMTKLFFQNFKYFEAGYPRHVPCYFIEVYKFIQFELRCLLLESLDLEEVNQNLFHYKIIQLQPILHFKGKHKSHFDQICKLLFQNFNIQNHVQS
jgi:hypothetical protein